MGNDERTFIMIKPDGVQRGLCGDIIKRFEQKGFKLVAMKFMQVGSSLQIQQSPTSSNVVVHSGLVLFLRISCTQSISEGPLLIKMIRIFLSYVRR